MVQGDRESVSEVVSERELLLEGDPERVNALLNDCGTSPDGDRESFSERVSESDLVIGAVPEEHEPLREDELFVERERESESLLVLDEELFIDRASRPGGDVVDSTAPSSVGRGEGSRRKVQVPLGPIALGLALGAVAGVAYYGLGDSPAPQDGRAVRGASSAPRVAAADPSTARGTKGLASGLAASDAPAVATTTAPPAASIDPAAAQALPPDQGYLVVRSSVDGEVYVTGFKIGAANRPNKSKCGWLWVRLGEGDPPRWISPGQTVEVKCQQVTTIRLDEGPSGGAPR